VDTGERLEQEDYDEGDWVELVSELTEQFCGTLVS